MEKYKTGTGQTVLVHDKKMCDGHHCCIHNPSDHHMKDWPTHWRDDRGLMERICPHGIGHPDPDDLAFKKRNNLPDAKGIHGCDGCCNPKTKKTELENKKNYTKKGKSKLSDINKAMNPSK